MTDNRNVKDSYKYWESDLIRADVFSKSFDCSVLMVNLSGDYNLGSIIRLSNGLGFKETFYHGKKKIDKRSTVGTEHYQKVTYLETFEDVRNLANDYSLVAIENNIDYECIPIHQFNWHTDKPPMIVIGEEACGLNSDVLELCERIVTIPMFGSVRSFNASNAAAIAMFSLISKRFI